MVVLLEPESLSHACSALSVIWFGNPEAPPRTRSASIFGLVRISRTPGPAPSARRAGELRTHNLIVDAPADILCPRLATVRPPGVLIRFSADLAKGVHV